MGTHNDEYPPGLSSLSGGKSARFARKPEPKMKLNLRGKFTGVILAALTVVGSRFSPVVRRNVATWIRHGLTFLAGVVGYASTGMESELVMVSGFLASLVMAGFALGWSHVEKLLDNGHEDPTEVVRRPEVLADDYDEGGGA